MPNNTDRNSSHLAGEYFVAAELYRRGYSVAITLGNAKAIDLFAERDARTVNVQVKAIRDRKSVGWPMTAEKVKDLSTCSCASTHLARHPTIIFARRRRRAAK